jgi:hypothetical protein
MGRRWFTASEEEVIKEGGWNFGSWNSENLRSWALVSRGKIKPPVIDARGLPRRRRADAHTLGEDDIQFIGRTFSSDRSRMRRPNPAFLASFNPS